MASQRTELTDWQRIGRRYLGLGDDELEAAVAADELTELSYGDED
jgi:hypothetical protein